MSGLRQLRLTAAVGVLGWGGRPEAFLFKLGAVLCPIGADPVFPLDCLVSLLVRDAANQIRFCVTGPRVTAPVGSGGVLLTFAPNLPSQAQSGIAGNPTRFASCAIPDDLWLTPGEYLEIELDLAAASAFAISQEAVITALRPA